MKAQDVLFMIILGILIVFFRKRPYVFVVLGLLCLLASIPLFTFWVFFTAQRLVYYAAGFILVGTVLMLVQARKEK